MLAAMLLTAINLLGALGYWLFEEIPPLEALYMSVITVSTVGFREVRPLDESGKVLTMLLIVFGVGAFTLMVSAIGNYVVAIRVGGLLEQRRMEKKLAQISDHYILCGYGRMGSEVARAFAAEGKSLVVIDRLPAAVAAAQKDGLLAVLGDGGDNEVLLEAGVQRAAGLISTLDNDADALFTVLSGRELNRDLFIIARANHKASETKLLKAGAQRVIWPYGENGRRMAHMALRPNVVEFL
ncbi:MAG: TrkA family potassium uptake protein, partial [Phycisphaerae bacterium]